MIKTNFFAAALLLCACACSALRASSAKVFLKRLHNHTERTLQAVLPGNKSIKLVPNTKYAFLEDTRYEMLASYSDQELAKQPSFSIVVTPVDAQEPTLMCDITLQKASQAEAPAASNIVIMFYTIHLGQQEPMVIKPAICEVVERECACFYLKLICGKGQDFDGSSVAVSVEKKSDV